MGLNSSLRFQSSRVSRHGKQQKKSSPDDDDARRDERRDDEEGPRGPRAEVLETLGRSTKKELSSEETQNTKVRKRNQTNKKQNN